MKEKEFDIRDDTLIRYNGRAAVVTIPDGVKRVGPSAFENNRTLCELSCPKSLEEIGAKAFQSCNSLKSVLFSENLCEIGESAFAFCGRLKVIYPLRQVKTIGDFAFFDCSELEEVSISPDAAVGKQVFQQCSGLADDRGFIIVRGVLYGVSKCSPVTAIPRTVSEIGDGAFSRSWNLTEVDIPDTVSKIGEWAFGRCRVLKRVRIRSGPFSSGSRKICSFAFYGCSNLEKLELPASLTDIGDAAFGECSTLADADGFVKVSRRLFGYYGAEKEITLPEGIEEISGYAFYLNRDLTRITVPDSVKKIGASAFAECHCLRELMLPESVTELAENSFKRCRICASA